MIAITQRPASFLGRNAAVCLTMPRVAEACPNGLAPTTSTMMTLALGDALAMVLMDRRQFSAMDFGLHHPGGALGMSLQSVREWMGDNAAVPASVLTTPAGVMRRMVELAASATYSVPAASTATPVGVLS